MKQLTVLIVLITGAVPAHAGAAFDCLETSAQSGGLEACLQEEDRNADIPGVAAASAPSPAPALAASTPSKAAPRRVPTPTGWTDAEDGTLEAGFFKGLDSGFKTVFGALEWPAVAGMEACGAPYRDNIGTTVFMALGIVVSIPASILGALVGAPIGAAAGMVAERAAPGSTKDWFTF